MTISDDDLVYIHEHGYKVIDNFLPIDLYKALLHELKMGKPDPQVQIRPQHYGHVFKSNNPNLPKEDEAYIAKFSLVKGGSVLRSVFREHLVPALLQVDSSSKFALLPCAVKLRCGDVYRAHQDQYAGLVGYTFFLNDGWCADYGGILTYVRDETTLEPIYPKANRLLLRNERKKQFHYLNTIEQFATKEQFLLVGWASDIKLESSKVRGEYLEI